MTETNKNVDAHPSKDQLFRYTKRSTTADTKADSPRAIAQLDPTMCIAAAYYEHAERFINFHETAEQVGPFFVAGLHVRMRMRDVQHVRVHVHAHGCAMCVQHVRVHVHAYVLLVH